MEYAAVRLFRLESVADSTGTPAGGIWSGEDGSYQLVARPGRYNIQASYISYAPRTLYGVTVEADTTRVDVALVPEGIVLDEVAVLGNRDVRSEVGVLRQQEKSAAVSDGISSDQIEKSTDSNAAEALSRVTGLTVVGGKYVFVRGLGERYSSTQINGSAVSSPEPNKRVVPLDMFASGLLSNLVVQKTYTPDQPGEFAGGVVNVSTHDFPTRRTLQGSVTFGHRSETTGEAFMTYPGGDTDWLAMDDGTRALPDLFDEIAGDRRIGPTTNTAEEIEQLGEALSQSWNVQRSPADPAIGGSFSFGDQINLLGKRVGLVASGTLSNAYQHREEERRQFVAGSDTLNVRTSFDLERAERSVLWGLLGNSTVELSDHVVLRLRNMYNRSAEDEVLRYEGFDGAADFEAEVTRFRYIERGIYTGNVELEHPIPLVPGVGKGADRRLPMLTWRLGYSDAERNEPDRREYAYERRRRPSGDIVFATRRVQNFTRLFGTTDDIDRTFDVSLEVPLPLHAELEPVFKAGYYTKRKDRSTSYRRFAFDFPSGISPFTWTMPADSIMSPEWIGGEIQNFRLRELTRPEDGFLGVHDVDAYYVMADLAATKRLRLVGGVRWEDSRQRVDTFTPFSDDPNAEREATTLRSDDALPAAAAVVNLADGMNARVGYSRTVNRPDIRELSEIAFADLQGGQAISGNPDLKRARIDNYDVRWELYPRGFGNELFAVSGFYKEFENAIEQNISGDQVPVITPENAEDSRLYGVELEARLQLARIKPSLNEWGVSANLTLVDSETTVTDRSDLDNKLVRPLQGQSPYVFNFGVFMQTSSGATSGSVLYNIFGRRLAFGGIRPLPDIYEQPRASLDAKFSLAHGFINIGFENILNEPVELKQDGVNDDDRPVTTDKYRSGRKASISIAHAF